MLKLIAALFVFVGGFAIMVLAGSRIGGPSASVVG